MRTRDVRIEGYRPLVPPAVLLDELPLPEAGSRAIAAWRNEIAAVLARTDDRLIVVAGPCSVHDVAAAMEYARRLRAVAERHAADLRVVMRVYFEKPRTTVGWKGLINDPHLDESYKINDGLRLARHLLLDLAEIGIPAGTEFLDMVTPQYLAGLVSWGAIGARTTESQVHRQLVSGLSCPVGFKNGTSGNVQIAIEAVLSAAHPHSFLGHTKYGQSAIFSTSGNPNCHIILRGGRTTVNYDAESVAQVTALLEKSKLPPRIMVDCSHANSNKDFRKQSAVCRDIAAQIAKGNRNLIGVMIESNLVSGAQKLTPGEPLTYGQSITDACIGWDETLNLLRELAKAVRDGRSG